jgi:NTP pyrophosphatase (non-canonical NTP hydrolase)
LTPTDFAEAVRNAAGREAFQSRVDGWMQQCFGPQISADELERVDRFTEEALELGQSKGHSAERAHALVDYVYGRDVGEPFQEVGGVMVTLAALCNAAQIDMTDAAETELARILRPEIVEKIRAKQAAKPTGSALPVPTPEADRINNAAVLAMVGPLVEGLRWYADDSNYRTFYDEGGDESIPCIPCDLTEADKDGHRMVIYDCGDRARAALATLETTDVG